MRRIADEDNTPKSKDNGYPDDLQVEKPSPDT